jgi:hypothetical protein
MEITNIERYFNYFDQHVSNIIIVVRFEIQIFFLNPIELKLRYNIIRKNEIKND